MRGEQKREVVLESFNSTVPVPHPNEKVGLEDHFYEYNVISETKQPFAT